jgi:hypothetical protein
MIGVDLSNAPAGESRSASGAVVQFPCAQVTIQISDDNESCSWQAMVGFLTSGRSTGLIGLAGFLEHFDTTNRGQARETILDPTPAFPGQYVIH